MIQQVSILNFKLPQLCVGAIELALALALARQARASSSWAPVVVFLGKRRFGPGRSNKVCRCPEL